MADRNSGNLPQDRAAARKQGAAAVFEDVSIHETAWIDDPVEIGPGTRIWHFSHILARTRIGRGCVIGQNVAVGPDVSIGDRCKLQNNVSVYKGVTLEDGVFCGPSCVFTNVINPRAEIERKDEFRPTLVRRGAAIGANATIVCGVTLGEYCMVGAGAVVTRDVPAHALVVGNPARRIGWVSRAGERLGPDLVCPRTGERHREAAGGLEAVPPDETITPETAAPEPIAFIDLAAQRRRLGDRIDRAIARVLDHGQFIMGPEVAELETRLAAYAGVRHAVSCSSGTDALLMALMAWGIGPGDAVFAPSFTFASTAEAPALLGATPVFCDVHADTFNLDPASLEAAVAAAAAAGLRPRAVIPVDLMGQPADYRRIIPIARAHGLKVLADAAQSFGAELDGRRAGGLADATATSFFPAKPLGCYGDGGAVLTDDDDLAAILRSIRVHGKGAHKYDNVRIGINGRLDTLQAAILLEKLSVFPDEMAARRRIARRYDGRLAGVARTPRLIDGAQSAWAQYTLVLEDQGRRDGLAAALGTAGVPTGVYYPLPLHRQIAYRGCPTAPGGNPVAESLAQRVLSLPMHPDLADGVQDRIVDAVARARAGEAERRD